LILIKEKNYAGNAIGNSGKNNNNILQGRRDPVAPPLWIYYFSVPAEKENDYLLCSESYEGKGMPKKILVYKKAEEEKEKKITSAR
jgi:hypothetical protein